jgi:prepilin-type N-terminal cleavage/methylation domain-containing protein
MKKGFTLIEMMTAVTVFLVVMTISMGAILGIFDANRKAESSKTVMDNLNFAVEAMSREIRFGKNYHCISTGTLTVPQNCPAGDTFLSFLSSDGVQTVYRLNGTSMEKSSDGGSTYTAVTAPEINISSLNFFVVGANPAPGDTLQPKVLIKITGAAGTKTNTITSFTLQTLASQRLIDN